jgi:N-acetylglutamate synthase-like GNAT family acetyltransferase
VRLPLVRRCDDNDFESIYLIINEAAQVYRGVIPSDRWKQPYMSKDELQHEIRDGVRFWGYEEDGKLVGVMGIQDVADVSLIRHAYVLKSEQNRGIGTKLLSHLLTQTSRPILVGTWAAATWAVRFYEKHGFELVTKGTKDRLLRTYWSIPERQIETSVVLADKKWLDRHQS